MFGRYKSYHYALLIVLKMFNGVVFMGFSIDRSDKRLINTLKHQLPTFSFLNFDKFAIIKWLKIERGNDFNKRRDFYVTIFFLQMTNELPSQSESFSNWMSNNTFVFFYAFTITYQFSYFIFHAIYFSTLLDFKVLFVHFKQKKNTFRDWLIATGHKVTCWARHIKKSFKNVVVLHELYNIPY